MIQDEYIVPNVPLTEEQVRILHEMTTKNLFISYNGRDFRGYKVLTGRQETLPIKYDTRLLKDLVTKECLVLITGEYHKTALLRVNEYMKNFILSNGEFRGYRDFVSLGGTMIKMFGNSKRLSKRYIATKEPLKDYALYFSIPKSLMISRITELVNVSGQLLTDIFYLETKGIYFMVDFNTKKVFKVNLKEKNLPTVLSKENELENPTLNDLDNYYFNSIKAFKELLYLTPLETEYHFDEIGEIYSVAWGITRISKNKVRVEMKGQQWGYEDYSEREDFEKEEEIDIDTLFTFLKDRKFGESGSEKTFKQSFSEFISEKLYISNEFN